MYLGTISIAKQKNAPKYRRREQDIFAFLILTLIGLRFVVFHMRETEGDTWLIMWHNGNTMNITQLPKHDHITMYFKVKPRLTKVYIHILCEFPTGICWLRQATKSLIIKKENPEEAVHRCFKE